MSRGLLPMPILRPAHAGTMLMQAARRRTKKHTNKNQA